MLIVVIPRFCLLFVNKHLCASVEIICQKFYQFNEFIIVCTVKNCESLTYAGPLGR